MKRKRPSELNPLNATTREIDSAVAAYIGEIQDAANAHAHPASLPGSHSYRGWLTTSLEYWRLTDFDSALAILKERARFTVSTSLDPPKEFAALKQLKGVLRQREEFAERIAQAVMRVASGWRDEDELQRLRTAIMEVITEEVDPK